MKNKFNRITLNNVIAQNGKVYKSLPISYEVFGQSIKTHPVVLINHAMTANSTVAGDEGWWTPMIDSGKLIDTDKYAVLAFNIPGNGYDGLFLDSHKDFKTRDIARIFLQCLDALNITNLFAAIGGSIGGAITWEMSTLSPNLIEHTIPVVTDWKATDWVLSNVFIQTLILENSPRPLYDARIHAMNIYRTPESYKQKFNRTKNKELGIYNIESWLMHHGKKLEDRFTLEPYKLMNHLIGTIDITEGRGTFEEVVAPIEGKIHIISVDSDMFFIAEENRQTYEVLKAMGKKATYDVINSIHGHDAFLIEFEKIEQILKPIFQS